MQLFLRFEIVHLGSSTLANKTQQFCSLV